MGAQILPVTDKRSMQDFLDTPAQLYANDPHFIRQLDFERKEHLSPKNPFFAHTKHQLFIAKDPQTNQAIGRISAQIDTLAQKDGAPIHGHIGFLEANNEETLSNLSKQAENYLSENGVKIISGPYSLSINDEAGLLIEGFDTPPRILMNHAQPWYGSALEKHGYSKAKDLLAYNLNVMDDLPTRAERLAEQAETIEGLTERPINMKNFEEDLKLIVKIFNDAWSENWGFIPMTDDEVRYMAENMKLIIKPDMARIIEINGTPAAMIVALPDMNEALSGLNGKLLPFGWAKLLWRLKIKGLRSARVLLMGTGKEWRNDLRGAALAALLVSRLHKALKSHKYTDLEMSWILEDNTAMCKLIEMVGGKVYKRYRIYSKELP